MPKGMEHSKPMNVPVSLHTRRNCFLICWFLREKLAMPRGMDSEHTSELAYWAKLLLNPLVTEREVSYAGGIEGKRTSEHAYPAKLLLNPLVPKKEVRYA